jgi:hypothetical protein
LPNSGAFYLDVQCQRAAYDGPIALEVEATRSGWQLVNNVIPAKANEVRLYVLPPWDFATGEIDLLQIRGKAPVGGDEISAAMATTTQLRAGRPQTPYPPAWHDGAILVSGLGYKPGFFTVSAKSSEVTLSRQRGQAQLALDFERTDAKFKDVPLTVLPLGLPAGMTAEVKRTGSGPKETYDIVFKGAKELAAGAYAMRYFAYSELAGQGQGVLSDEIRLNVVSVENPPAAQE